MPDIQDQQAANAPEGTQAAPAEAPAAGSQPVEQTPAPATEGQPVPEAKSGEPTPSGEPEKPKESGPQQDFKPTSRRSAQYRIQQLTRQKNELEEENARLKGTPAKQEPDEGTPQFGDEPQLKAPDVSEAVRREAARILDPVLSQHRQSADDQEISELFSGDLKDQRATFEPKIRDAWKLDQYKDLAAGDVFKILNYDSALANAQVQAVEDYKKAVKEAKESSASGTSNTINRHDQGGNPALNLTDEEFIKHNEKIKAGL
jgi:hypothetical protein